jgi:hypothetical protein
MRHGIPFGALAVLLFLSATAFAQTPIPPFSDQAVENAIEKATKFLLDKQQPDGSWPLYGGGPPLGPWPDGPTALATYALLESGLSPQDARMKKALEWLQKNRSDRTYCLGLRSQVWLSVNRPTKGKYLDELKKDVEQLWKSTADGSYTYGSLGDGKSAGDNSNSQYGLLGVWAGLLANVEIPKQYWTKVMRHWLDTQNGDGGWPYAKGGESTPAMTTAGLASMFVCYEVLYQDEFIQCKGGGELPQIKKGLEWMDKNFKNTIGLNLYYAYGVERVGLASGYKYFGMIDWYKVEAMVLATLQSPDGSWPFAFPGAPDVDVSTSYGILFLVRGRNAVLFNKLEHAAATPADSGDWNNRPRDLATLTRWLTNKFERTVNWQIVNLKVPVKELHDAPLLYIAGSKAVKFSDEEMDKLRTFVLQGGTILSVPECHGIPFDASMKEVYKKLFPKYELTPCGPKHEICTVYGNISGKPKLSMITNGVRALAIHVNLEDDLPLAWQQRHEATERYAYDAASNIYMYVTDKGSLLRPRGTNPWPDVPEYKPLSVIRVARLAHSGNYDPEPLAMDRFARLMAIDYQIRIEDAAGAPKDADHIFGEPIPINELVKLSPAPALATLTGTGRLSLTSEEVKALQDYVNGGGTLLISPAGGNEDFARSAEDLLNQLYGINKVSGLASSSPLYNLPGMTIKQVKYRKKTATRLGAGNKAPNLRAVMIEKNGKSRPGIIYSREDILCGLVGYASFGMDGYDPGDGREPPPQAAAAAAPTPEVPAPAPAPAAAAAAGAPSARGSAFDILRNIVLFAANPQAPAAGSAKPTTTSTSGPVTGS